MASVVTKNRCSIALNCQDNTWKDEIRYFPKDKISSYTYEARVGTYLAGRIINAGCFATVKESLHIVTGEKVAIKILDKQKLRRDQYAFKHLYREAKILQNVNHPYVVQLLETFETDSHYYIVTELVRGKSMINLIDEKGKLNEHQAKKFIHQIVVAVEYLHKEGIIHRDLKIENLLTDEDQNVKVIDFGLSTFVKTWAERASFSFTRTLFQSQCGSPAYAAPELLARQTYGPKVDIWSIGVIMFVMLTGSLPFTTESNCITTLYRKIVNCECNPIPDSLSEDARDLQFKLLTVDQKVRISLTNIEQHKWLQVDNDQESIKSLKDDDCLPKNLDKEIIKTMNDKLGMSRESITRALKMKLPCYSSATYKLTEAKVKRYFRTLNQKRLNCHASSVSQLSNTKTSVVQSSSSKASFSAAKETSNDEAINEIATASSTMVDDHVEKKNQLPTTSDSANENFICTDMANIGKINPDFNVV